MQPRAAYLPPLVRDLVCCDRTTLSLNPHPPRYLSDQGMLCIQAVQSCIPQSVIAATTTISVTTTASTAATTATTTTTTTTTPDDTISIRSSAVTTSAATVMDPHDLDLFKAACITVQSELVTLSKDDSKQLRNMYAEPIEWLGVPGMRAAEIWLDLYEKQVFDQALIVGSTVLEQLVGNVSSCLGISTCHLPVELRW